MLWNLYRYKLSFFKFFFRNSLDPDRQTYIFKFKNKTYLFSYYILNKLPPTITYRGTFDKTFYPAEYILCRETINRLKSIVNCDKVFNLMVKDIWCIVGKYLGKCYKDFTWIPSSTN